LNGGRAWLTSRFGDVREPTRVTTIPGTAALSWSAMFLVISPGAALSSRPAWSAAVRVPRSLMITYLSPSR
jgi:hypothetical protein